MLKTFLSPTHEIFSGKGYPYKNNSAHELSTYYVSALTYPKAFIHNTSLNSVKTSPWKSYCFPFLQMKLKLGNMNRVAQAVPAADPCFPQGNPTSGRSRLVTTITTACNHNVVHTQTPLRLQQTPLQQPRPTLESDCSVRSPARPFKAV